jgi:hypothetical protein
LTTEGPQFFRFSGPGRSGVIEGAKLVVKREGTSTIYECAMPWNEIGPRLPAQGAFSFGLYLNDSDGRGRKGFLQWGDIKNPSKMQPIRLNGAGRVDSTP